ERHGHRRDPGAKERRRGGHIPAELNVHEDLPAHEADADARIRLARRETPVDRLTCGEAPFELLRQRFRPTRRSGARRLGYADDVGRLERIALLGERLPNLGPRRSTGPEAQRELSQQVRLSHHGTFDSSRSVEEPYERASTKSPALLAATRSPRLEMPTADRGRPSPHSDDEGR